MRDVELYKTILGLTPPWTVVDVTLDVKGQHVTVRVHAGDGPFPCPACHDAVDTVRKAEHRALQQAQDDRLTGTKVPLTHARP